MQTDSAESCKKGYSFTVYAGDFDQLIERGVWDEDVGGYQNGVLVEIDDKWNSNTSVSYIIGATAGNLAAVYYPENQAVFQMAAGRSLLPRLLPWLKYF